MNITSKFIYAKTRSAFERERINIPIGLNPLVFIEDTREMWTMGTYFSIGYPSILVSEISGAIKIEIGNSSFSIETSGQSLSIKKGEGNNKIIISSDALTLVNTEPPLEWDITKKKLFHSLSGVVAGVFGQSTALENASIFYIPYLTVDKYGHINSVQTKTVSIRDYVEQLAPGNLAGNREVLLSYNTVSQNSDTAQVRKANGLSYNDITKILTVESGINVGGGVNVTNGDLVVINGEIVGNLRGNVTGEATPKIHLSEIPEYGGASTNLYGHVKVQDILGTTVPLASSTNSDPASASIVRGIAASPKMVWDVRKEIFDKISDNPYIGGITAGDTTLEITESNQIIEIRGESGLSVTIDQGGILIKGIEISGYDDSKNLKIISNNMRLSQDFTVDDANAVCFRWDEINN